MVPDRRSTDLPMFACGSATARLNLREDGICVIELGGVFTPDTLHISAEANVAAVALGARGVIHQGKRAVVAAGIDDWMSRSGVLLSRDCDVPGAYVCSRLVHPLMVELARKVAQRGFVRAAFTSLAEASCWVVHQARMAEALRTRARLRAA